jgi:dolichol kinase
MFGIKLPVIYDVTLRAARGSELHGLVASPILYALGMILSLTLFPEPIGYASIAVLTFGDGFASIFGRKFGVRSLPFNENKTIEGSIFGFILALIGSLVFIDPLSSLISSIIGMLIEALPIPVNDNITIPLASGLASMAILIS